MRKRAKRAERRKETIFAFNHIDPAIQEEELEKIKKLYRFYHKMICERYGVIHDAISFP